MILKNFIVFEGIDGAGTSTQIKKICEKNPQKFFQTAEPTSLETGKFLRRMLGGILKSVDYSWKFKIMGAWAAVWPGSYALVHRLYEKTTGLDKIYEK